MSEGPTWDRVSLVTGAPQFASHTVVVLSNCAEAEGLC
jgi:hypothetical protein